MVLKSALATTFVLTAGYAHAAEPTQTHTPTQARVSTSAPNLDVRPFVAEVDKNSDGCMSAAEWFGAGLPGAAYDMMKDKRGCVTQAALERTPAPPTIDTNGDGKLTVAKMLAFEKQRVKAYEAASSPAATNDRAATPARSTDPAIPCDRACLQHLADEVLASIVSHDPSKLPIAPRYRLTVNNVASGLVMATPWRTITGVVEPGVAQYVVDTPRQEVFFTATIKEGDFPALLWGRLKVEDGKLSELELYEGRSKADSGMQFDPMGAVKLPNSWTTPIPAGQHPSRDELTRVAKADFDPSYGLLKRSPNCILSENGQIVEAAFHSVEELRTVFGNVSPAVVERVRQSIARHEATPIPCVDAQPPVDKSARILVDEQQAIVVTLGNLQGTVWPNFTPPPGPNPDYPTSWVPADMMADNQRRADAYNHLPTHLTTPVERPTAGSLAVAEINRFYGGEVQATHRLMMTQPPGALSPWTMKDPSEGQ